MGGIPRTSTRHDSGLAGRRPPDSRLAHHGRETGHVDPVRAGDEAQDGLVAGLLAGGHEDERLDDLGLLHAEGPGGIVRRVGGRLEHDDPQVDPLPRGGVHDAPNGGIEGLGIDRFGHGRESSTGCRAGRTPAPRGAGVTAAPTRPGGTVAAGAG